VVVAAERRLNLVVGLGAEVAHLRGLVSPLTLYRQPWT
tara:strand:+ start:217 stop:330 length:114 start_codon:yes stop_codon:yes gene_type:complete